MTTPTISRLHRAVILSLFILSTLAVRAAVANPAPFDFRQPDGTIVTVRLNGDEFAHWYTDLQGNRMVLQSDGFLRPATLVDDLKSTLIESRSLQREPKGIGISPYRKVPHTGNIKVLVMLVQFADVKFTNASTKQAYINRLFNESGFSSDGNSGSVRDYFVHQSGGAFTPQFVVHGPVTLSGNRATYAEDQYKMVTEGSALMDNVVDFSEFDNDNDGYIDVAIVIFAGAGADSGTTGAPWPHKWSVTSAATERFTRDGKTLALYCTSAELYADVNPIPRGIGTIVHEFSHCLGLADHYNTENTDDNTSPKHWDVMASGSWNNTSKTPPNYSVFELEALDWLTPAILAEAANISLPSLNSRRYGVKIHTDRPGDYFLLENRTKAGFDAYLPGEGLLIWHIDASDESKLSNRPNVDNTHRRVDLIRADNEYSTTSAGYLGDPFPGSKSKTSFTSSTTPAMRRWNASTGTGTTAVNKPVTSIAKTSDGTVTFKFMGGNASNVYSPDKALVYYTITTKPDLDRRGRAYIGRSGTATSGRTQKGDSIILRAVPATDYTFSHWTNSAGTRVGTSNPIRLIPSKTDTYTAVFTRNADAGAELCIPSAATHKSEDYISRLYFSPSGSSLYVSPLQSSTVSATYFDKNTSVLSAKRGERLLFYATASNHNTHTYIYIDRNREGFDYSTPADYVDPKNNYAPRPGSDLIYYSAWSPDGGTSWYNSTDGAITADKATSIKASDTQYLTIPSDLPAGTYTLRFKSQQCSLDPCGGQDTDTDESHSLKNAGGIIVDIRLKVNDPATYAVATGVRPANAGTIECNLDRSADGRFYYGFPYRLTAKAKPGYRFSKWITDGSGISKKDSVVTFSYNGYGTRSYSAIALFDPIDTDPSDNPDYCQPEGLATFHILESLKAESSSGTEITISSLQEGSGPEIYCDRTTYVLTTWPGATVTITPTAFYPDSTSHAYIYVDWDRNGFIYRDYNDYVSSLYSSGIKKGVDLVYFSLHRTSSSNESYGSWYSSGGISSTDGTCEFNSPCSFTIPADTPSGDYRIRFKRHWNSFDPCGLPEPEFYDEKTIEEMSGCIVDFTLRVVKQTLPEPRTITLKADYPAIGKVEFTDPVTSETTLSSDAMAVSALATPIEGASFISWTRDSDNQVETYDPAIRYDGTTDIGLTAHFGYKLTCSVSGHGSAVIRYGTDIIRSGTTLPPGAPLEIEAKPDNGYQISHITVNGHDIEADGNGIAYLNVAGPVDIGISFIPLSSTLTLLSQGNGTITAFDDLTSDDRPTGTEFITGNSISSDTELFVFLTPGDGENLHSLAVTNGGTTSDCTDEALDFMNADGQYIYIFNSADGNVTISALFTTGGADISAILQDPDDPAAPLQIFTVTGIPVRTDTLSPGFYIVRRGGKMSKILVR